MSGNQINLDLTLGAIEIGAIVSTFLFGILTLQVYTYYSNFPADMVQHKLQVAFIWLCELGYAICVAHLLYVTSVTNYGDSVVMPPLSLPSLIIIGSFIPPMTQFYFASRVYGLSKKRCIPAVSNLLSLLVFIGMLVAGVTGIVLNNVEKYMGLSSWLFTIVLSLDIVNDTLLTTTLITYLYRNREFGQSSTVHIVDKLIKWTLETGLLTTLTNVMMIVCFLTMKQTYIWITFGFILARVYSNCYLAALNSRLTLRAMKEDVIVIGTHDGQSLIFNRQPTIQIDLARTMIIDAESNVTQKNHAKDSQAMEAC